MGTAPWPVLAGLPIAAPSYRGHDGPGVPRSLNSRARKPFSRGYSAMVVPGPWQSPASMRPMGRQRCCPQTAGNGGNYPPERDGSVSSGAGRWKAGATTKTTPARRLRPGRKDRASPSGGAGLMRRVAPHRPAPGLPAGDARCICTSTASAPRTWPPRHPGQRCLRGATSTRSRRLGRPTPPRSGAGARGTAPSKPGLCGDLLAELRLGHAGQQVSGLVARDGMTSEHIGRGRLGK